MFILYFMRNIRFWSVDRIVTICAISISLFTLVVFMHQTRIIERQSRLSALPYLAVEVGNNVKEKFISITLSNYGVGPAIVDNILIFYNGDWYNLGFAEFVQEEMFSKDSLTIFSSESFENGMAIPSGAERVVLRLGGTNKEYISAQLFLEKLVKEDFDYQIIYSSIYEDKWKIHSSHRNPIKL